MTELRVEADRLPNGYDVLAGGRSAIVIALRHTEALLIEAKCTIDWQRGEIVALTAERDSARTVAKRMLAERQEVDKPMRSTCSATEAI